MIWWRVFWRKALESSPVSSCCALALFGCGVCTCYLNKYLQLAESGCSEMGNRITQSYKIYWGQQICINSVSLIISYEIGGHHMLAVVRIPSSNSVYTTMLFCQVFFHHSKNCISNACFETRLLLCGKGEHLSPSPSSYCLMSVFTLLLCVSRWLWEVFLGFSLFSTLSRAAQIP